MRIGREIDMDASIHVSCLNGSIEFATAGGGVVAVLPRESAGGARRGSRSTASSTVSVVK